MYRIVVVGSDQAARLVVEQVLAINPEIDFTIFGPTLAPREANWFKRNRVDLRHGIEAIDIDRFARKVTGSDGSRTVFHRLILTQISLDLARRAKLQVARGVLVNAFMQTSDGYVYAMGESVECPAVTGLGSLKNQAKIIAQHVCASSPRLSGAHEYAQAQTP